MSAVGVIPARYASSRFPGKVLHPIAGVPMIQRVWEGARSAQRLERVLVATEDPRVVEACAAFGAEAMLTSPDHPCGTDRAAEAAAALPHAVVVNIQGDEPLIEGHLIDAAVKALESDLQLPMATVAHPAEPEALDDPNRVKVVLDRSGDALYFSRSRIPAQRDPSHPPRMLQHVGLYAYRREFLQQFVKLAPTPAEQAEALEQLRALEHGFRIRVAVVEGWQGLAVDVPDDVEGVEARLRERGRA